MLDHKTVADYIRTIPDFPHEGILFRDVTTLFLDPRGFRLAIDQLLAPFVGQRIDKVAGLEARGFILGGAVAHQLSVGFVPVRKKGKLPGATVAQDYTLEYGTATVEIHDDCLVAGRAGAAGRRPAGHRRHRRGGDPAGRAAGRRGDGDRLRRGPAGPWRAQAAGGHGAWRSRALRLRGRLTPPRAPCGRRISLPDRLRRGVTGIDDLAIERDAEQGPRRGKALSRRSAVSIMSSRASSPASRADDKSAVARAVWSGQCPAFWITSPGPSAAARRRQSRGRRGRAIGPCRMRAPSRTPASRPPRDTRGRRRSAPAQANPLTDQRKDRPEPVVARPMLDLVSKSALASPGSLAPPPKAVAPPRRAPPPPAATKRRGRARRR